VSRPARMLLLIVLVASAASVYPLRQALQCRRYSNDVVEEMTYYPSGKLLKVADLGFSSLVADAMWLRGIQYYGQHRKTDRRYPLAEHIFSTITDVDPAFTGAYRFGAMVLSDEVGAPAVAVDLLRKGLRADAGSWEIPFDLGFIYFIALGEHEKAAHYFKLASRFAEAPEIAGRFAASAYRRAGRADLARALWQEIARSSSIKVMRETADYSLKAIDLETTLEALQRAVASYQASGSSGGLPTTLADLAGAGLVGPIPPDPFGGAYFLDQETGVVGSTTVSAREAERAVKQLQRQVRRYRDQTGDLPPSLAELKRQGLIADIPRVVGTEILYDPATGVVSFGVVWKESGDDDPVSRRLQTAP
jgi:tetratricopeptide (TPR) repeat protein